MGHEFVVSKLLIPGSKLSIKYGNIRQDIGVCWIRRLIMARQVTACPVCDAPLEVTELTCAACRTRLHGHFPPPPLARLAPEHQSFIETFVRCRGVIRDVERALGISYPTVRARLDTVVEALEEALSGAEAPRSAHERDARRRSVLQQVEEGSLEPDEAAEILRRL
jgi:hypothetical protein